MTPRATRPTAPRRPARPPPPRAPSDTQAPAAPGSLNGSAGADVGLAHLERLDRQRRRYGLPRLPQRLRPRDEPLHVGPDLRADLRHPSLRRRGPRRRGQRLQPRVADHLARVRDGRRHTAVGSRHPARTGATASSVSLRGAPRTTTSASRVPASTATAPPSGRHGHTSHSFTGLTCDTAYTFALEAFDAAGDTSLTASTAASQHKTRRRPPCRRTWRSREAPTRLSA